MKDAVQALEELKRDFDDHPDALQAGSSADLQQTLQAVKRTIGQHIARHAAEAYEMEQRFKIVFRMTWQEGLNRAKQLIGTGKSMNDFSRTLQPDSSKVSLSDHDFLLLAFFAMMGAGLGLESAKVERVEALSAGTQAPSAHPRLEIWREHVARLETALRPKMGPDRRRALMTLVLKTFDVNGSLWIIVRQPDSRDSSAVVVSIFAADAETEANEAFESVKHASMKGIAVLVDPECARPRIYDLTNQRDL